MKASFLALSAAVLVACAALSESAAQQVNTVARVNAMFDRLESQWFEGLDVSESLAPGRQDLVTLVRKDPSIAQAWQLEPSLVSSMTDAEIVNYVATRANTALACGLAQMTQKNLDQPSSATAGPSAILQRLWKSPPVEGRFRMSPNCAVLLDESRQPASLTGNEDLGLVNRMMARFDRPRSQSALFEPLADANLRAVAVARLKNNVAYLRREYGGMPRQEPDIEAILEPKDTQVFSRQVLMFQAFIASTTPPAGRGGQPFDRLVLVVPLSE